MSNHEVLILSIEFQAFIGVMALFCDNDIFDFFMKAKANGAI